MGKGNYNLKPRKNVDTAALDSGLEMLFNATMRKDKQQQQKT